jgi:hypothetical protein
LKVNRDSLLALGFERGVELAGSTLNQPILDILEFAYGDKRIFARGLLQGADDRLEAVHKPTPPGPGG